MRKRLQHDPQRYSTVGAVLDRNEKSVPHGGTVWSNLRMLVALLLLFVLGSGAVMAQGSGQNSCTMELIMHDQYGDGWNGATLALYQHGELLLTTTLASGSEQRIPFNSESDTIVVMWSTGMYDNECSFIIKNEDDDVLITMNSIPGGQGNTYEIARFMGVCPTCPRPQMTVSNRTASGATISWAPRTGATWQLVYGPYDFDPYNVPIIEPQGNSYTLSGLQPNTAYSVGMRVICSDGDTSNGSMVDFVTLGTPLPCSYTLSMGDDNNRSLNGNKIVVFHSSGVPMDTIEFPANSPSTSRYDYTFSLPAGQYYLGIARSATFNWYSYGEWVRLYDADGTQMSEVQFSNVYDGLRYIDSFAFQCPSCISPSGLAYRPLDSTSVQLFWDDMGAQSYLITLGSGGGGTTAMTTLTTTDTTMTMTGLTPGSQHVAFISAVCSAGDTSVQRVIVYRPGAGMINKIYVTPYNGQDTVMDGRSWATAFHSVADAQLCAYEQGLMYGNHPDIWVAEGNYNGNLTAYPSQNIYGGFVGNEVAEYDITLRDWRQHRTTINGNWSGYVMRQTESFTAATQSLWDGIEFANGELGAGCSGVTLMAYNVLRNCVIQNCYSNGGGYSLLEVHGDANNIITALDRCQVGNAWSSSSAVFIENARVDNTLFSRMNFVDNAIVLGNGGSLRHCDVVDNTMQGVTNTIDGYCVVLSGTGASVTNSILWGNSYYNQMNNTNAIITDNVVNTLNGVTYTALNGTVSGTGNISLADINIGSNTTMNYPVFVLPSENDWRLNLGSDCIDAATSLNDLSAYDLLGNPRQYGSATDMGCFENDGTRICLSPSYINSYSPAPTTIMVNWSYGSADSYEVSYKPVDADQWSQVSVTDSGRYLLTNMGQNIDYMIRVRARCGEEYTDWTDTTYSNSGCSYPIDPLEVGGSYSSGNVPIYSYYPMSGSYSLYKASELDYMSRTINSISLKYSSSQTNTRHITVVMTTTDANELTNENYISVLGNLQEVFSGDVTFSHYNWQEISLQVPVQFDGLSNLVIGVFDSTPGATTANRYFGCSNPDFSSCLYLYGYSSENMNGPYSTSYRPNIRFNGGCDESGCPVPHVNVQSITSDSVTIVAHNLIGDAVLEMSIDNRATFSPVAGYIDDTTSLRIGGLTANTHYWLRLRSLCGSGDTSLAHYAEFTTAPLRTNLIYVKQEVQGTRDGGSWSTAFADLNEAVDMAGRIYQYYNFLPDIWVAAGTYYGDTMASSAYTIDYPCKIYGGFVGNESTNYDLSLRDFRSHATILDGRYERRVLTYSPYNNSGEIDSATFDGFTLRRGYSTDNGAGILCSYGSFLSNLTISDCHLVSNYSTYGGGIYTNGNSNLFSNILVDSCSARYGAGIYSYGNRMENVRISHSGYPTAWNSNVAYYGALYSNNDTLVGCIIDCDTANYSVINASNSYFENCLITNNASQNYPSVHGNNYTMVNCDVVGNRVYSSSVLGLNNANLVEGCIVWGNTGNNNINNKIQVNAGTVRYSAIQGGAEGSDNITLEAANIGAGTGLHYPFFVAPTAGDWRLMEGSACIDAGGQGYGTMTTDLAGQARVYGTAIDMGCFENHNETFCIAPIVTDLETSVNAAYLSWYTSSSAESVDLQYRVQGNNEWTTISNITTGSQLLGSLTGSTDYEYRLRSNCGQGESSEWSTVAHFSTQCTGGGWNMQIGQRQDYMSGMPIGYTYFGYNQTIYTHDEIGDEGYIDTLRYYINSANEATRYVKIYMGSTDQTYFNSSDDRIGLDQQRLVYDGPVVISSGDTMLVIPLDESYDYDGLNNLVITFADSTANYTNSSSFFVSYPDYNHSYSLNSQDYSWYSFADAYLYTSSARLDISFAIRCPNTGCPRPMLSVGDVTSGSAAIFCSLQGTGGNELQYAVYGSDSWTTMPIVQNQTLEGLMQNTRYVVRARSVCGAGDTSQWRTVTFTTQPSDINRIYVTATGTGDGTSWQTASGDFTWALNTAQAVKARFHHDVDIWVAKGTWHGGWTIPQGVNVYGSFAGNEPSDYNLSLRDFAGNASILDGDDQHRVLYNNEYFQQTVVWDGFTVRNGNANNNGGAVYAPNNMVIRNFTIENSHGYSGGGLYLGGNNRVENTVVRHCTASYGGAVYGSSSRMVGCTFEYNTATDQGGALYGNNDTIVGCRFIADTAYSYGALYVSNGTIIENSLVAHNYSQYQSNICIYNTRIIGSTIVDNIVNGSTTTPAVYRSYNSDQSTIRNSILWHNRSTTGQTLDQTNFDSVQYCAIEGGLTGMGNIVLSTMNDGEGEENYVRFASPDANDYRVLGTSAVVDAGYNDYSTQTTDIVGHARIYGDIIDMGCYENDGSIICVYPYNINHQVSSTAAIISWQLPSDVTSVELAWRQQGSEQWTVVSDLTVSTYLLEPLLPETGYEYRLRSQCGTEDESAWSPIKTITSECSQGGRLAIIGNPNDVNTTSYLPLNSYYRYSFSQQLYEAALLGGAGIIDTLRIKQSTLQEDMRYVMIYMGITEQGNYSSGTGTVVLLENQSLVFDGQMNLNDADDGWQTIALTQPFDYNGIGNLVITVIDTTGTYSSTTNFARHSVSGGNHALYKYSDNELIEVNNETSYSTTSYVNTIALSIACPNSGCARPLVAASDVTSNSAVVLCQTNLAGTVELQYKGDYEANYTTLPVTASQTLSGLRQNMRYEVRARTICGVGDTSLWRTVTFTTQPSRQSRYYVAAGGTGDGSSWTNATGDLDWALRTALAGRMLYQQPVDVWVAEGTYYGGFEIVEGVPVYGGFAGNEAATFDPAQRNVAAHATILDGQNHHTVLRQANNFASNNTLWDGFIIQHGRSTSSGGGVVLRSGVTLSGCTVMSNRATDYGGGIYANNDGEMITRIVNCQVLGDTANYGGGIYAYNVKMENVLVANNSSRYGGSGLYLNSNNELRHMTIVNNYSSTTGTQTAGLYFNSTYNNYVYNSIIWGNRNNGSTGTYQGGCFYNCAIDGSLTTNNNNNIFLSSVNEGSFYSPRFVNPTSYVGYQGASLAADWHLSQGSICVDHGNAVYTTSTYDLAGAARVQQGAPDMGCYESGYNAVTLPQYGNIVYVKTEASGTGDGSSWENAMGDLNDAQHLASVKGIHNVWMASGIYYGRPDAINGLFTVVPSVNVYGGFAGTEPAEYDLSLRDFETNATILDGGGQHRVLFQNSTIDNVNQYVEWNGLTIRNGNAKNEPNNTNGGGAYLRTGTTLRNCVITGNQAYIGGGVYMSANHYNQTIQGKSYRLYRGRLENCVITGNTSTNDAGGVYLQYALMTGCEVSGNSSQWTGGGVYSYLSHIVNSTIVSNQSANTNPGGLYMSNTVLANSIVWGNKQGYYVNNLYYSGGQIGANAIEGFSDSLMVLNLESSNDGNDGSKYYVRFVDPQHGDYSLHVSSPCVNMGDTSMSIYMAATDIAGTPRVVGGSVDLGAYETNANTNCPSPVAVRTASVTNTSATIMWTPMGDETNWNVRVRADEGDMDTTLAVTDTIVNLTGLQLNRSYSVYVRAVCTMGGASLYSIPCTFTTLCDPNMLDTLADFTQLTPDNGSSFYTNYVDFAWNAMPMATSYDFYFWRSDQSEPATPTVRGLTTASIHYNIPDYANNHGYTFNWKVVAWNECINKTSATQNLIEAELPNLHVSALSTSTPVSGNTMTVEWTVVNDGAGATPPGATWNDYIWITGHNAVGGGFLYGVDEVLLATVPNLQSLAPGQSYTNSTTVQLPQDHIGNYFFFALADQYSANNIDYSPSGDTIMALPYTPSITGTPYPYLISQNWSYPANFIHSQMEESVESDNFFYIQKTVLPPPTPDLQVTAIVHPVNAISGDSLTVQWTTTNMGDAAAQGYWRDAVYISASDTLVFANAILLGSVMHDGTLNVGADYTASVRGELPLQMSGAYNVFVYTDIQNSLFESIYDENNIRKSDNGLNVVMAPPADLQVSNITPQNSTVNTHGQLELSYTVTNAGARAISGRWSDAIYLSMLDTFNLQQSRRIGYVVHNRDLAIEESFQQTVTVPLPDSIVGQRWLYVRADVDDDVFEHIFENNNISRSAQPLSFVAPDLTTAILSAPDTIVSGDTATIVWRVANNGLGAMASTSIRSNLLFNGVALSQNAMGSSATLHNDYLNLVAGDSVVYTSTLVLPCQQAGSISIEARTDILGCLWEADETNNSSAVNAVFVAPDLTGSMLAIAPDTLWSGTQATASWTVQNLGGIDAMGVVTDSFYLRQTGSNVLLPMGVYTRELALAAGASLEESCMLTLPNGVSGSYELVQHINATGSLCEGANAADNTETSSAVTVMLSPYPDLTVQAVSMPVSVTLGQNFIASYTLVNNGIAALQGRAVTTRFYLSHFTTFTPASATLVGDDVQQLTLDVNQSTDYTAPLRVPTTLTTGNYYLHAVTDATDVVYEYTYEDNNVAHSMLTQIDIYPLDISISQLSGEDPMQWGGNYTYTLTVSNNSTVPTIHNLWRDRLFLSQDNALQTSDQLIGERYHREVLEADSSYTEQYSFTMPFGMTSPCYLIAVTDIDGQNPDINQSNNMLVLPVTVSTVATPDLVVSNATIVDSPVFSGQTAHVAYTITNNSEENIVAGTWTDKVFLSNNASYESTDQEVGTVTHRQQNLAAGASYTDTATFRVPLPQNGTYYLIVRANTTAGSQNATLFEANTANNMLATECTIVLPNPGDLVVRDITMADTVVSGDLLSVQWKVRNIGDNTLTGNELRSLVYISSDTTFDAGDRLLGNAVSRFVNLFPGDDLQQSLTARVAALDEGNYYLIVKTDVAGAFNEVNTANNSSCSPHPVAVVVRRLAFNTPLDDTLFNDLGNDYRLDVGQQTDQTVRVWLRTSDSLSGAVNNIYLLHNGMGSDMNYDLSTSSQSIFNPELYIPATLAGYYGINVTGNTPTATSQAVTIEADILPFELRTVSPNQGGNTGRVTVMLTGSRFAPDMQVTMSGAGGTTLQPVSMAYESYYKAYATFDLNGVATGSYDVSVTHPTEGVSTLAGSFTVVGGTPENLYTNLVFPQSPRPNRTIVAMLEYVNNGNTDIVNPTVTLNSIGGIPMSLTPAGLNSNTTTLTIPLQPEGEPEGVLRPGVSGYVNVYIYSGGILAYALEHQINNNITVAPIIAPVVDEMTAFVLRNEGCQTGNDGQVTVLLPAGTDADNYSYRWYTAGNTLVDTTRTLTGLTSGGYRVQVALRSNPNVVEYEDYLFVDYIDTCNPLQVHLTYSGYGEPCTLPSIEAYATATGGTAPYSYSWPSRRKLVSATGRTVVTCRVVDAAGNEAYATAELYLKKQECSQDPNEIKGPEGYDDNLHYVNATDRMNYTIGFENDPDFATAPATRVSIVYPVPERQNITSMRLSDFGFGNHTFTVPANSTTYSSRLDLDSTMGIWVDVTAGIDMQNNQLFWIFQSIDPSTGFEPASSQMGFLPVNDSIGTGEGFVSFLIAPKAGTQTGDTVEAQATIVFDDNAPIATNVWKNTFDAGAPSSSLHAVWNDNDDYCTFSFTATDDANGTGVDRVELYVSHDEEPYLLFGSCAPDSTLRYPLTSGGRYQFLSVAVDRVGNREASKAQADTVLLNSNAPTDILLTSNHFEENAPQGTAVGRLTTVAHGSNLSFTYQLVAGEGDADNSLFQITDGRLQTNSLFNCKGRYAYSVRVRTTDITGATLEKAFAINVIQQNYPAATPVIAAICDGQSYTFGTNTLATQGVYVDSLHTIMGCDSVVTLTLTVHPVYSQIDNQTACDSYTWMNGTTYTASTNTPTHLMQTVNGCDSLMTLHLTINNSNTGVETQTACDSYTWHGTVYTASTTTPTFVETNVAGCDSTVTLHLTINNSNTGVETQTACDSYTWHGTAYTASTTTPTFVETNAAGCDSTVTLHLTINNSTTFTETVTACDSYTWHGTAYTASTNTPTYVTTNAVGCDSTVTLHLTINNSNTGVETQTACDSYTWHGTVYAASTTTPTFVETNVAGCDSTVTLHLTINNSNTGVETQTACDSYTWHGTAYTASTTTPTYVETNAAGCDSTVTLHLTINNSTVNTETATACDSYTWHGTAYTQSTNTATYVTTNAIGCDSTITLHLTINNSTSYSEMVTACDTYTWHGTAYTASTNTPTYQTTNAVGCDSTVTLHLTINYSNTGVDNQTVCDSYTWHGTVYTASTTTPTFVETNAAGCDSTVTLHLTVNYSNTGVETQTACDSYTWHGTAYTASTTTPTFVETNVAGCDSTVTLHLTINNSTANTETATACDSYTWHGTVYITSTDTATFVTTNAVGCDSTITLNLTINVSTMSVDVQTACDSYTWIDGTEYTQSTNTPTFMTTNAAGCDSTITLNLTINYSANVTIADTAENSFVWNGTTYTESGTYTWQGTTEAGCDSTVTLNLVINTVGIDEVDGIVQVSVYPNPTNGLINIVADGLKMVELYDIVGRKIATYTDQKTIDLTQQPSGTYTLRICHGNGVAIRRVVKR